MARCDGRNSSPFTASPFAFLFLHKRRRKRNAGERWSPPPHLAMRHAPCRARSSVGVPPRLSPKGIIPSQRLGFRPGFLGCGLNGRYPPSPVPVQGCTSHPGHNAGRLIPKPPGSSMQNHPRAPHPLHLSACLRKASFGERDESQITLSETIVNRIVTATATIFPTFPWRGKVHRRPPAAVLLRKERRRGASAVAKRGGLG